MLNEDDNYLKLIAEELRSFPIEKRYRVREILKIEDVTNEFAKIVQKSGVHQAVLWLTQHIAVNTKHAIEEGIEEEVMRQIAAYTFLLLREDLSGIIELNSEAFRKEQVMLLERFGLVTGQ